MCKCILDRTKPVQTRDGRQVRSICWDYLTTNNVYMVAGVVKQLSGYDSYTIWHLGGRLSGNRMENPGDLVNVEEAKLK